MALNVYLITTLLIRSSNATRRASCQLQEVTTQSSDRSNRDSKYRRRFTIITQLQHLRVARGNEVSPSEVVITKTAANVAIFINLLMTTKCENG